MAFADDDNAVCMIKWTENFQWSQRSLRWPSSEKQIAQKESFRKNIQLEGKRGVWVMLIDSISWRGY